MESPASSRGWTEVIGFLEERKTGNVGDINKYLRLLRGE
jgi:hypothetical protein